MTNSEFLHVYREKIMELSILEREREICGTDGKPSGVASVNYSRTGSPTNDRSAADVQRYDGLTESISLLQQQIKEMEGRYQALYEKARNYKERYILRQYYKHHRTDANIAEFMDISTRHANRLRSDLLQWLDHA